jgi:hypothetical protein
MRRILQEAATLRELVAKESPKQLSPRHLIAVLLRPGRDSAIAVLAQHGCDSGALRRALFASIGSRQLGERPDVWRELLLDVPEDEPRVVDPAEDVRTYAGFSTDGLFDQRRPITPADDRLDVMRDVTALCEVLAARETRPPLAVGLFGDWGTGKSFFMELMRKEMNSLGARSSAFYCGSVVQVEFNAWHYMDADLWASLASRIFESLATKLGEGKEREAFFQKLADSKGMLAATLVEKEDVESRLRTLATRREALETSLWRG